MNKTILFCALVAMTNATTAFAAFEGDYAPENWVVTEPGPSAPVEVEIEGAFDWFFDGGLGTVTSLEINSPDCDDDESPCSAPRYRMAIEATAAADAFIQFEWQFRTGDGPSYDSLGIWRNGSFNYLVDTDGPNDQTGAGGFNIAIGDSFGFGLWSDDSCCGASWSEIYNFEVGEAGQEEYGIGPSPVPLPASVWLLGSAFLSLAGLRGRRKSVLAS